jgi:hypothetical protein
MTYFGSGPFGKRHKRTKPKPQAPLGATVETASDAAGEVPRDQLRRPAPTTQKD